MLYETSHPDNFNHTKRNLAIKRIATELSNKIEYNDERETNVVVLGVEDVKATMNS